jgi:hypothetical protein
MYLTEKEIIDDFYRFIRFEAMAANVKEDVILKIITSKII